MNEGHPAFALLERIRERVEDGMAFDEAVQQVRATSVFTTHTPVPAGHDVFPFDLMDKYICHCYPMLGLSREDFFKLGTSPTDPPNAGFNMTAFALRLSAYHNGVSRKHGEVARRMWQPLWPDLPVEQVPIDHITNGVHVPTWIDPKLESPAIATWDRNGWRTMTTPRSGQWWKIFRTRNSGISISGKRSS